MKIAQIAPLFESVPPRLYGGTERVVSYLTDELVRRGHDVTLFASGAMSSFISTTIKKAPRRAPRGAPRTPQSNIQLRTHNVSLRSQKHCKEWPGKGGRGDQELTRVQTKSDWQAVPASPDLEPWAVSHAVRKLCASHART
jgi:hypothetical protein